MVGVRTDSGGTKVRPGNGADARHASGFTEPPWGGLDNGKPGVTRGRKATGLFAAGTRSQPGYRKDALMTYWDGTRWIPEPSPRAFSRPSILRRLFGAWAEAALITLLMFGLIAGTTLAAKPPGSSVWVNELGADARAALRLEDAFTVGYTSREREPYALAQCFPNETTEMIGTHDDGAVWSAVFSVYPGGPTPQSFVLGDSVYPLWTGGGADCTVSLVKYSRDLQRMSVLAATSFTVAP